jgi:hypothetical protein
MAFSTAPAVHSADRRVGGARSHPRRALPAVDNVTVSSLIAIVGTAVFLQRFAVPFGASQVPAAFVANYLIFLTLLCRGRLVVNTGLFALFMVTIAFMTIPLIVSATKASLMSYADLLSIYGLYIFKLKYPAGCFRRVSNAFLDIMALCAALGIAQFVLQFVLNPDYVFPLDTFTPDAFLLDGFNVIIPLEYLSSTLKSNGVFFLEPSFYSQFLAVAAIIELMGSQRVPRLLLYAAAMVLSYSGTGLMLLFMFLPWTLMRRSSAGLLMAGIVLLSALVFLSGAIDLSALIDRVGEFSSTNSSGFARFISPFLMLRDFVLVSPGKMLFGLGPGSIEGVEKAATTLAYLSHDPTWIKVVLEYGLIAATLFFTFIASAFFQGSRDRMLAAALLFFYLFLGGYLLNGFVNCLFMALVVWHSQPFAARRSAGGRREFRNRRVLPPPRLREEPPPPVLAR